MKDRSHLVPHPILDSAGRRTVVYRRPGAPAPTRAPMPPARVVAQAASAPASGPAGDAVGELMYDLRDRAAECVVLFNEVALTDDVPAMRRAFKRNVETDFFGKRPRHGALVTAALYGPVYAAMDEDATPADAQAIHRAGQFGPTSMWSYWNALSVADTLIKLHLMRRDEVPTEEDNLRFLAHLCADKRILLDYSSPEDDEDLIALIDRHPDRLDEITNLHAVMSAEKLEVVLRDSITGPLASGAL